MKTTDSFFVLKCLAVIFLAAVFAVGCAQESKHIRKLTKPIDTTAEELVKVRQVTDTSGSARAIISPADEKQLRIPF